jgi:hypothetical protein
MRIAFYSSKRERCGISTYTDHLAGALTQLGHQVKYFSSSPPYDQTVEEILSWHPEIFHVQHEAAIMPPNHFLKAYCKTISDAGAKVYCTIHGEVENNVYAAQGCVTDNRRIIMHRPPTLIGGVTVIPMPCPIYNPPADRGELRDKYGIPRQALLISTVGFMIPWKEHPRILERLTPLMAKKPEVHVQVIASDHFHPDLKEYAVNCRHEIAYIATRTDGRRVHHISHYPSDLELLERLAMSDLGYIWCPFNTGSSSAAAGQFTSARVPAVASESTHYSAMGPGFIRARTPTGDTWNFIEEVEWLADDPAKRAKYREYQEKTYQQRNYLETAKRHVQVYREEY